MQGKTKAQSPQLCLWTRASHSSFPSLKHRGQNSKPRKDTKTARGFRPHQSRAGVTAVACFVLIQLYTTTFEGECIYLQIFIFGPLPMYMACCQDLFFSMGCEGSEIAMGKVFYPHRNVCNTKNLERIRPEEYRNTLRSPFIQPTGKSVRSRIHSLK